MKLQSKGSNRFVEVNQPVLRAITESSVMLSVLRETVESILVMQEAELSEATQRAVMENLVSCVRVHDRLMGEMEAIGIGLRAAQEKAFGV